MDQAASLHDVAARPIDATSSVDEALEQIHRAFRRRDTTTSKEAKVHRYLGMAAAVIEPLAVVPLIFQVVLAHENPDAAVKLIGFELFVLVGLLVLAFADIGPSQDAWMRGRVRTEVLRRERFLLLARVGPYLRASDPARVAQERLRQIDDEVTPPDSLILLEDPDGKSWRTALEEAGPDGRAPADPRCMDEFSAHRLDEQEHWYAKKSHEHEDHYRWQEAAVRITLVLAVVMCAIHLTGLLSSESGREARSPGSTFIEALPGEPAAERALSELALAGHTALPASRGQLDWLTLVELVALILPTVSAAAFALQSFLDSHRLSRTYWRQSERLQRLGREMDALRTGAEKDDTDIRLKRLVLETEGILAEELLQWWLHAYRY